MGLDLLENATAPRTTVQAPLAWPKGDAWKAKKHKGEFFPI